VKTVAVNSIVNVLVQNVETVLTAVVNNVKNKEIQMKDFLKNKKVWIGAAVVVIIFAWVLWSGQPAPVEAQ
jgi:magnesium-transporting ATPase (P-type)